MISFNTSSALGSGRPVPPARPPPVGASLDIVDHPAGAMSGLMRYGTTARIGACGPGSPPPAVTAVRYSQRK